MSILFDDLKRMSLLYAYATTGNESFLKDIPPMSGYNEPTHLPQPKAGPYADPVVFDELDEKFMVDLTDQYIGKELCALMGSLHTMGDVSGNPMLSAIKEELIALRRGLQEKFREDY